MREDRRRDLDEVLYRMARLWLYCNDEERETVKKEFEKFMKEVVS